MADYNKIGVNYNKTRKADLRIFGRLYELLGKPVDKRIIDIGAGTGNYTLLLANKGNKMVALELSTEMIHQADKHINVEWIQGYSEDIPVISNTFDDAICILSIHHFSNRYKCFNEIFRILRQKGTLLIYTFIPDEQNSFWLRDYFPELFKTDADKFPGVEKLKELTKDSGFEVSDIIKHELHFHSEDNFLAANWRQPEKYLREEIRNGISTFSLLPENIVEGGLNLLRNDLKSGEWNRKYGHIKRMEYLDAGYRFLKFERK